MKHNKLVLPVLKWVGGKRQLLPEIKKHIPSNYTTYYEPFIGGGAVLFALQPKKAIVNDINSELINFYKVVKTNVEDLIADLKKHKNEAEYFYKVRAMDRDTTLYDSLTDIERASRIHFLNKTCYNGLFRVNRAGQFNAPFGKYKKPNIENAITLRAVSKYFNSSNIEFKNLDFRSILNDVEKGAFVYLDPPYDPISDTSNFTGYSSGGFGKQSQKELKLQCDNLTKRGIKFLLSNAATDFIFDLYKNYHIETIQAKRSINSKGNNRGEIDEILVRNYE